MISPFWLDTMVDDFIWKYEMDFGNTFSSQMRSNSVDADFWLIVRLASGRERWMIVGKYPRRLENLNMFEAGLSFRFLVTRLSSSARTKPVIVAIRAISFR